MLIVDQGKDSRVILTLPSGCSAKVTLVLGKVKVLAMDHLHDLNNSRDCVDGIRKVVALQEPKDYSHDYCCVHYANDCWMEAIT